MPTYTPPWYEEADWMADQLARAVEARKAEMDAEIAAWWGRTGHQVRTDGRVRRHRGGVRC
jgi:hypothetical protein